MPWKSPGRIYWYSELSSSLSISVVTYRPDLELLARLLGSVRESVALCKSKGFLSDCAVTIVDNSISGRIKDQLHELTQAVSVTEYGSVRLEFSERNMGYGNAHNRTFTDSKNDYHLVLNPDVLLEKEALYEGLQFLEDHKEIGLLTPYVADSHGVRSYLCKRYPTVLDLLLRGFAPSWLRARFTNRLDHYEMRDLKPDQVATGIPIASGCFMLIRNQYLQQLAGFDPGFFLYFEDFDLSLRMGKMADIAYVPAVKIIHYGGEAARKGPRHIFWFIRSAITFFNLHGWKWW